MKRNINSLNDTLFDILIIGGGIHGAASAYYAAREGFKTAIIDKNDFCSATSANSLKILHGGLRYLQHLNIKRMRHSIWSRKEMMKLAPSLVAPLPCLMPTYGYGAKSREVLGAALLINDIVSYDRNSGLTSTNNLKRGHTISPEECLKIVPNIPVKNLRGAAIWHDAIALNTERLALEYILQSVELACTTAANYIEAQKVSKQHNNFNVQATDVLTGKHFNIKAKNIINASGPWIKETFVATQDQQTENQQWALAINIIIKKQLFKEYAVGLEGSTKFQDKDAILKRDKRLFFFVPWNNYTMIGTSYKHHAESPSSFAVKKNDLLDIVKEINSAYPAAELKYEDITFYHAGLLPIKSQTKAESIQLEKNSKLIQHGREQRKRFISIKGVKYTTAPHIAKEVITGIKRHSKPSCSQSVRDSRPRHYPQRDNGSPPSKQDIVYFIKEEMAVKLSDVIFRRTNFGTAECPPIDSLINAAHIMAGELSWDDTRKTQEVNEVLKRYNPLSKIPPLQ